MAVSITYSVEEFSKALESSFIQKDPTSDDRYTPRLLTNEKTSGTNVLSVLKNELRDCVSFDFSVAFITSGGIQVLVEVLADLGKRRIPGRILTSTYLNFNEPDALRKLLEGLRTCLQSEKTRHPEVHQPKARKR